MLCAIWLAPVLRHSFIRPFRVRKREHSTRHAVRVSGPDAAGLGAVYLKNEVTCAPSVGISFMTQFMRSGVMEASSCIFFDGTTHHNRSFASKRGVPAASSSPSAVPSRPPVSRRRHQMARNPSACRAQADLMVLQARATATVRCDSTIGWLADPLAEDSTHRCNSAAQTSLPVPLSQQSDAVRHRQVLRSPSALACRIRTRHDLPCSSHITMSVSNVRKGRSALVCGRRESAR